MKVAPLHDADALSGCEVLKPARSKDVFVISLEINVTSSLDHGVILGIQLIANHRIHKQLMTLSKFGGTILCFSLKIL